MMMDFRKKQVDGELKAIIDGQEWPFEVKEIERKNTYIKNVRSINTTLREPIEIFMYIYGFYNDKLPNNQDLNDINSSLPNIELIEQGNVLITIGNKNTTYYKKRITFKDGLIQLSIPNDLSVGEYYLLVEYEGNKYYLPTSYKTYFNIEKRKVICTFDNFSWESYPNEPIEIGATFTDKENKKIIRNLQIKYSFGNSDYITKTDDNGYTLLSMRMPKIKECSEVASYPLNIEIDNDIYVFEGITKYISAIKYNTSIKLLGGLREEINHLLINGNVVNEFADNVHCGEMTVSINDTDIQKTFNIIDGLFNDYLPLFELINDENPHVVSSLSTFESEMIDTITTLTSNKETIKRNYKLNHYITFEAEVKDKGNNPAQGMVSFVINEIIKKEGKTQKKETYRYVTELDDEGMGYFNFHVSKVGNFEIQVFYHESFFFNQSESEIKTYKVEE